MTVIPIMVAGRVAITRTGRLRKVIRENIDLLGTLPDDHPSRATVETHIEELVDRLIRREQRLFEPITPPGTSFGVNVALAGVMVLGVCAMMLAATGVWDPVATARRRPPPTRAGRRAPRKGWAASPR
jgi:hypothetical protein